MSEVFNFQYCHICDEKTYHEDGICQDPFHPYDEEDEDEDEN